MYKFKKEQLQERKVNIMDIVSITAENRFPIDLYIEREWSGPLIVTLGHLYDSRRLPGYAAYIGDQLAGAILYRPQEDQIEIAVLFSLIENHGVGTALIKKIINHAAASGCSRIWLVTSNDNTHAIRFYQKFGFSLKEVHINSFDMIRRLKPGLPEHGIDNIPLNHEFEFELFI